MTISLATKRAIALAKGFCGKCYTKPTKIRNGVQLRTCDDCLASQSRYQKKQDSKRSLKRALMKQGLPIDDGFCIECQATGFHRRESNWECPVLKRKTKHSNTPLLPVIAFETQSKELLEED